MITTPVTLSKGGSAERTVAAIDIQVPDLWHIAMHLKREGAESQGEKVLECWHLCHDLLRHIQESETLAAVPT